MRYTSSYLVLKLVQLAKDPDSTNPGCTGTLRSRISWTGSHLTSADDGNAYTEVHLTEELIVQRIVLAREEFLAAQAAARNADLRRP